MKVGSRKFALDSSLEGDGFEPSVPIAKKPVGCRFPVYRDRVDLLRHVGSGWRTARRMIMLDQNVL
jgi:hypothetical protein